MTLLRSQLLGGMKGGPQVSPHPAQNDSNFEEKSLLTLREEASYAKPEDVEFKLCEDADQAIAAYLRSIDSQSHRTQPQNDISPKERQNLQQFHQMNNVSERQ